MSFVSLAKWFRWLCSWTRRCPHMIIVYLKWLQSNRFTFVILQFHFLPNDAKMQYKLLSKIAALLLHSHTHKYKYKYINVDKKHQLNFYTNFPLLLYFFDFSRQSQCFCVRMRAHWAHTHIYIYVYICICMFYVSVCVCFLWVQAVPAPLWLEMRKSVFVHIKYSCIILNPLAIFSIWFSI